MFGDDHLTPDKRLLTVFLASERAKAVLLLLPFWIISFMEKLILTENIVPLCETNTYADSQRKH